MKVGIIGYGSIGKRHINNLLSLGIKNIVLLREKGNGNPQNFDEVFSLQELFNAAPDFIILSNPTAYHFKYLEPILKNNFPVLAEKPLVFKTDELESIKKLLQNYTGIGMTAFNLRFHPCIIKTLEIVKSGSIGKTYHTRFFVGQYLPDWHPESDYTKSYSAIKELGGGVLFDLIHEIDLALLFSGKPSDTLCSVIGNVGELSIETEDIAEINYVSVNKVLVNIHLDYLTRGIKRNFQIFGTEGWINCDLIENKIIVYGAESKTSEINFTEFERNQMYLNLMKNYLMSLESKVPPENDLFSGIESCSLALKALQNNNFKPHE